jgi:hypothetical protein
VTERIVCEEYAEIFERHVAGLATTSEAAAFSSHSLGCELCAAALKRVYEFDSKFGPPPEAPRSMTTRARSWRARHPVLVTVLSFAMIGVAAVLAFRSVEKRREPTRVVRSRGGTMAAVATLLPDGGVRLAWPRIPRTLVYHVTLEGASGTELSKNTPNPSLVLPEDEIGPLGDIEITVEAEAPTGERTSGTTSIKLVSRPDAKR